MTDQNDENHQNPDLSHIWIYKGILCKETIISNCRGRQWPRDPAVHSDRSLRLLFYVPICILKIFRQGEVRASPPEAPTAQNLLSKLENPPNPQSNPDLSVMKKIENFEKIFKIFIFQIFVIAFKNNVWDSILKSQQYLKPFRTMLNQS